LTFWSLEDYEDSLEELEEALIVSGAQLRPTQWRLAACGALKAHAHGLVRNIVTVMSCHCQPSILMRHPRFACTCHLPLLLTHYDPVSIIWLTPRPPAPFFGPPPPTPPLTRLQILVQRLPSKLWMAYERVSKPARSKHRTTSEQQSSSKS
jgi:hypothetical protein